MVYNKSIKHFNQKTFQLDVLISFMLIKFTFNIELNIIGAIKQNLSIFDTEF